MKRPILAVAVAAFALTAVRCSCGQPTSSSSHTFTAATTTNRGVAVPLKLETQGSLPGDVEGSNPTPPMGSIDPDGGPENPICVNFSGPGADCWGEWLKEPGNVNFNPVARGALGAGPWPTTSSVTMGTAQGLQLPILYVGVDTGQNLYAVSTGSLFIRRVGQATFEEYDQATNGLKDYPFLSVAGQAPGVAYVGHVGLTPPSEFNDPPTDPPELLQSGGIDKVVLTANGIQVTPYWTHNSNSVAGSYSHDRTLYNLLVPRRGPAAGELYSSSEHCITRRIDDTHYASHRHVEIDYDGSAHYGMARAVTVTDDGYMWYGSDYAFGALHWQPRLYEWYFDNDWIMPTRVYSTDLGHDWYRGIGVDSKGNVWAAAWSYGLVNLVFTSPQQANIETLDLPDVNVNTLVVDLDDSVWIGADSGVYRYVPSTQTWTSYPDAGNGISYLFMDDTVTPRALYAATNAGIWVYRGQ